jgi:nucleotide-binding universal stress UspA family protein
VIRSAVVGVDGSVNSLAALAWASSIVASGGELHVVSANQQRDRADIETSWNVEAERPDISTQLHLVDHDPAEVIVEFADAGHSDLVVLGTHAGPPLIPRGVGSVTHKVLRLTPCPVAVVNARAVPTDGGPVVVGVGDGPATQTAIEWSARFAAQQKTPLHLLRAVDFHPIFGLDGAADVMASYLDPHQLVRWAEDELENVASELTSSGLDVKPVVVSGSAGHCLVNASHEAAILVLGKHFDGQLTGYLTGRCLHHTLTHAECPVVVVPQARENEEAT